MTNPHESPEPGGRPLARSPSPLKIVELLQRGDLAESTFLTCVVESLTHDNADAFVKECPADVLQTVARHIEQMPNDDDDKSWEQVIVIVGGMYAREVTPDQIKQSHMEHKRRCREGVRSFRAAIANQA